MIVLLVLMLAAPGVARAQLTVVSSHTVYLHPADDPYDPLNRTGFNHAPNVTVLPDGKLFAAWFSGPFEASVHQSVLGSYSSDSGRTWSPAQIMNDFPRRSDFDPALLSDGRRVWMFFSAGRWNRYPFVSDETNNVGVNSFQIYLRATSDSGRTWSEVQPAQIAPGYNCRNNGIRLAGGELLLPVTRLANGRDAGVLKSIDEGKTWRRYGGIWTPEGQDEPTIVELRSGNILMFLRTGGGTLWKTGSRDKGETWSPPQKTGIVAARSSHSLFRLQDGRIVLTHNASPDVRTPLTMRTSSDDGESWDPPLLIAEAPVLAPGTAGVRRQVSYPSVAQMQNGDLVVLWADIGISDTVQYGDIRCARVSLARP
jgi:predicted neuraminidase